MLLVLRLRVKCVVMMWVRMVLCICSVFLGLFVVLLVKCRSVGVCGLVVGILKWGLVVLSSVCSFSVFGGSGWLLLCISSIWCRLVSCLCIGLILCWYSEFVVMSSLFVFSVSCVVMGLGLKVENSGVMM